MERLFIDISFIIPINHDSPFIHFLTIHHLRLDTGPLKMDEQIYVVLNSIQSPDQAVRTGAESQLGSILNDPGESLSSPPIDLRKLSH